MLSVTSHMAVVVVDVIVEVSGDRGVGVAK